jgi:peptide/nickel transport system substrate-binding protein
VKFNIERHKSMAGSNRRGDWRCNGVDVIDESTVRLNLSAPFSPYWRNSPIARG